MMEQKEEIKFPEHIMETLRERRGLAEEDTSKDSLINTYSRDKAFSEMMSWQGFNGWEGQIKTWIEEIYEIDLNDETKILKEDKVVEIEFNNKIVFLLNEIWKQNRFMRFNQLLYVLQKDFDNGDWVKTAYGEEGMVKYSDLFNAPDNDFEKYLENILENGL